MHFHTSPVKEAKVLVGLRGQGTGRASPKLRRGVTVGSGPLWSMWMGESSCKTLHRAVQVNVSNNYITLKVTYVGGSNPLYCYRQYGPVDMCAGCLELVEGSAGCPAA